MKKKSCIKYSLKLLILLTGYSFGISQNKPQEFLSLNSVKLNIGLLGVNEIKPSFEKQIANKTSIEFSPCLIFKHDFWYSYSDEIMLSKGFGAELSIRRFFDKKRYIFQPFFRSYLSFAFDYKHTSYDSLWFVFRGAIPSENECTLTTKKFDFIGMRLLFGMQRRSERFIIDIYGGLGVRMISRDYQYLARNLNGEGCDIVPTTEFVFDGQKGISTDFSPSFHAGIKLGVRLGKPKSKPKPPQESNPEGGGN